MSLINQVLKDLEMRHAREMAEATQNLDGLAMTAPAMPRRSAISWRWLGVLGACVGVAAGSGWWWGHNKTVPTAIAVTQTTAAAPTRMPTPAVTTPTPPPPVTATTAQNTSVSILAPAPVAPVQEASTPPPAVARRHARSKSPEMTRVMRTPSNDAQDTDGVEKQAIPLSNKQQAELIYQKGYDYLALHDTRRAEQSLRQALNIDSRHARARELLAGILIKQGRWIETVDLMQSGLQAVPGNLVFVKLYARTLMQINRDSQAIAVLRASAPPMAQDPDYYALLAALYQRQQDHHAAATTYSQILKLQADRGIWWVGLGISLEALGKQAEAQQAYAKARKTGSLRGDLARYTDNRLLALDAIKYPE